MSGAAAGALLAETRRRPGRLLLTGLAILVATAFSAGTLLLSETLRGYVAERAQETPAAAAAVVLPDRLPGGAAAPLPLVAGVDGVAEAVGVWGALLPVAGAGPETVWEISSDPMAGPLSRLSGPPVAGRLPAAPDEVLVGAATAARTGLAPGASLTVTAADGTRVPVTVVGAVDLDLDGVNALVGLPGAVAALGGELEQVDVAARPGAGDLTGALGAALGAPDAVRTGAAQRVAEAESASSAVTAVLLGVGVFAGLAVIAAGVVVASTFRIVLTQRRTQLALLRCVGAGRGQVVRAVLAEAAVSGLVAGLLGAALAVLGGYAGLAVAGAVAGADVPVLVVPWAGIAGCAAAAVLVTLVSALAPALAAGRVPPVAALGASAAGESGSPRPGRRAALAGLLAAVAAGTAALAPAEGTGLVVVAGSGLVAFAAIVAAGPLIVRALAAAAGPLVAAVGGAPGRLAVANAAQVPRRTAATIAVLALGVGLTAALLVALASTRADAQARLEALFPAAIAVGAPDPSTLDGAVAAEPALVVVTRDAGALHLDPAPGVAEADARRAVEEVVTGRPGITVQYASDARADLESVVLTLTLIGLALVGMTLLVAVVGVGVTLTLSVTERTRETGVLRALGLDRAGVRATVAWEAALCGSAAAVLGVVVGAVYGVRGAQVLGVGSGFTPGSVPVLAALAAGVVAVAVVAAAVPAVRAGRTTPLVALAH